MLRIREKNIKFKRNVTAIINKTGLLKKEDITGDLLELYRIFKFPENFSFDFVLYIINKLAVLQKSKQTQFLKYILKCGEKKFSEERYHEYCEYRKINPSDCSSDQYFKLLYGDDWKKERDIYWSKKNNMYDPYYISKRDGLSLKEAKKQIKKLKKEKATSLDGFIKRHDKKKGVELFKQFQETSKLTKDGFIKKYGEKEGITKWEDLIKNKRENSVRRVDYWLNRGYNYQEAEKLRKKFHKENLNTSSVDFWIKKGLSNIEAQKKVAEIFRKKHVSFCNASKQSLKVFLPVISFLCDNKLDGYHIGYGDRKEFYIYDKKNKKLKFYDLTIPELNIIIEFHGYKYHPNKKKLTQKEWENWKCFGFPGRAQQFTADEKYALDKEKENIAKKNGFFYLVVWSDDSVQKNINKCIKVIKKVINENKIN